jgi:hypothetical protein
MTPVSEAPNRLIEESICTDIMAAGTAVGTVPIDVYARRMIGLYEVG